VFLIFLLLWNVFTHQSCDDSKKRLRQWFNMYGSAATENKKSRLAAAEKMKVIMTKIKTCNANKKEKWFEELEKFLKVLPELNTLVLETFTQLDEFQQLLKHHAIEGWSTCDVKLDSGLSAEDRIQQSVRYLQQVCVSQKLLGKFGREYNKVKQILSATSIQKWYRPKYRRWIKAMNKAAIGIQALRRGYNARKQMKAIGGEIATNGSPEPSTEPSTEIETPPGTPVRTPEIETRPGTPVGTPETLKTPPQKQPEQSTAPVVVVPVVSKARAPTRAGAPVMKPSAELAAAPAEWRTECRQNFRAFLQLELLGAMLWYIHHTCNLM
jgi:hypothetical protein